MKYTIIYTEGQLFGSHYQTFVKMKRVETSNISDTLKDYPGTVMVFEGWPKMEGE